LSDPKRTSVIEAYCYRGLKSNAALTVKFTIQEAQLFVEGEPTINIDDSLQHKVGSVIVALPASFGSIVCPEETYVAKWTNVLFNQMEELLGSEAVDVETIQNKYGEKDFHRRFSEIYAVCKAKHYRFAGYGLDYRPNLLDFEADCVGQESEKEDTERHCDVRFVHNNVERGPRDGTGVQPLYLVNGLLKLLGHESE
jgi:hypothetical protein